MFRKVILIMLGFIQSVYAADLIQVYKDALKNDPQYLQALAQQLSNIQGVPIQLAALLPNVGFAFTPYYAKTDATGSAVTVTTLPDGSSAIGSVESKGYGAMLTANQPVFDFIKVNQYMVARDVARQAQAMINAAGQDLMVRVAKAYLALAADEENLIYIRALRSAYEKQWNIISAEHHDGYKSIIDVNTARASYEKAKAKVMEVEIQKMRDQEQLHIITNQYYPRLLTLKATLPLIYPNPLKIDEWVRLTIGQNWRIRSAEFARRAALRRIKQQWGGHLPTLYWQNSYNVAHANNSGDASSPSTGTNAYNTLITNLALNVPIYQGGGVDAQVVKAKYDLEYAVQILQSERLNAVDLARESFFSLIARIDKIKVDQSWVKATASSVEGMQESYKLGTERLTNVLIQRENLQVAQSAYTADRYLYVTHFLVLKQASGLLSCQDLMVVNGWLG
jgi:outer membrane protein